MILKYRSVTGQEITIQTEQELAMALRTRRITAQTLVQLPGYRSWTLAGTLPEFAAWAEQAAAFAPAVQQVAPPPLALYPAGGIPLLRRVAGGGRPGSQGDQPLFSPPFMW